MMGGTHRLTGAAFGLGYGMVAGLDPVPAFISGGIAFLVAGGALSPDVDQRWAWRIADDLLPDELLDRDRYAREGKRWSPSSGGPMQHRGITHWWGVYVVLAALWGLAVLITWVGGGPLWWWWIPGAVISGWVSHLFGDFLFGQPDPVTGRGGGIPLYPWWGHVGVEWDAGGALEKWVERFWLPFVVLPVMALAVTGLLPRLIGAATSTIAGG